MATICLKCDKKWRNNLQHFLNQISGPPRKNPLICHSDVKRITKAICTCPRNRHQAWNDVTLEDKNKAHEDYTKSRPFLSSIDGSNISIHRQFYESLRQNGLFENIPGLSSADRLVYIISRKIPGNTQPNILDVICPVSVQSDSHTCHIGSLRQSQIGRFIGRGGTGIRDAIHGIPVGNVTILFDNSGDDMVEARATYSCRRRHQGQVGEQLRTRASNYREDNIESGMDYQ